MKHETGVDDDTSSGVRITTTKTRTPTSYYVPDSIGAESSSHPSITPTNSNNFNIFPQYGIPNSPPEYDHLYDSITSNGIDPLHDELLQMCRATGIEDIAKEAGLIKNGEISVLKDYSNRDHLQPTQQPHKSNNINISNNNSNNNIISTNNSSNNNIASISLSTNTNTTTISTSHNMNTITNSHSSSTRSSPSTHSYSTPMPANHHTTTNPPTILSHSNHKSISHSTHSTHVGNHSDNINTNCNINTNINNNVNNTNTTNVNNVTNANSDCNTSNTNTSSISRQSSFQAPSTPAAASGILSPGEDSGDESGKKRKRGSSYKVDKEDKGGHNKGLRHFSLKVCQKVETKRTTSYNEVADELVGEIAANSEQVVTPVEQKNIRRRVYDVLNVLMAMNIISKDKKEIHWIGLPTESKKPYDEYKKEKLQRLERIKKKKENLAELMAQQVSYRNLLARNNKPECSSISMKNRIYLPFIVVNTKSQTVINCEVAHDRTKYFFNFSNPFEIYDDNEVLKRMGLGSCAYNDETPTNDNPQFPKTNLNLFPPT